MTTTYNAKIGNAFDNQTIRVFQTREEASEFCNKHFAETGESAWVSEETAQAEPVKTFATPACGEAFQKFEDRGLIFTPIRTYEYKGETWEEWDVEASRLEGMGWNRRMTWKIGTYKTQQAISANQDDLRAAYNIH